jgi:peptidoglycan hydrolase-like protein with peptidoglycan-binding domain
MSIRNKILTAVLGLSLVAAMAPGIASAALTSSQVSAIISLLQSFGADSATISNVQASLTGGTPQIVSTVAIPAGFVFTRTLYVGATGQDVSYLKVILTAQGCFTASIANTGFGPLTQAGVKCFQAKYGINQVGAVGPITNAKLNSLLGGAVLPPGCTSTSGYSSTTGQACSGSTVISYHSQDLPMWGV